MGALLLLAGSLQVVTPAPASASSYYGTPTYAPAQSTGRYSRVRTFGGLAFGTSTVRAYGHGRVDKPSGCYLSGTGPSCPPSYLLYPGWASFNSVEITVNFNGWLARCSWGAASGAPTWMCTHPTTLSNPAGAQAFTIKTQMCFDVKYDGYGSKCTPWSSFTRYA